MTDKLLSTEQVLLLENLMYLTNSDPLKSVTEMESGKSVADLVNVDVASLENDRDYGSFMTGKDWKNLIGAVKNDETLMNMQITAVHEDYAEGGGGGVSAVFANRETGEAVVAFRGTANMEWKDDFVGGAATNTADSVSTRQQMNALEWYQSLDLDEYGTITVTGHSKGGNKAKYITVMDGSVDRCISFDGQGFSDEFMEKYNDLIAARQSRISNYNAEYDYVNLLLNDVGSTSFFQGHDFGAGGFLENHCPNTLFQFREDGTFAMLPVGKRADEMAQLDKFLNSYLRSLDGKEKQKAMEVIGLLVEQGFNNATMDDIFDTLLEGDHVDQLAYLIAYFMRYVQETPEFLDAVKGMLQKFDMDNFITVIDTFDAIVNWKHFDTLMGFLSFAGSVVPDWILEELAKFLYDQYGLSLTADEIRKLLSVIGKIDSDMEQIAVYHNGDDIAVTSAVSRSFSIKTYAVGDAGENMRHYADQLRSYSDELEHIAASLDGSIGMIWAKMRMKRTNSQLAKEAEKMAAMGKGIDEIIKAYSDTEDRIGNRAGELF